MFEVFLEVFVFFIFKVRKVFNLIKSRKQFGGSFLFLVIIFAREHLRKESLSPVSFSVWNLNLDACSLQAEMLS